MEGVQAALDASEGARVPGGQEAAAAGLAARVAPLAAMVCEAAVAGRREKGVSTEGRPGLGSVEMGRVVEDPEVASGRAALPAVAAGLVGAVRVVAVRVVVARGEAVLEAVARAAAARGAAAAAAAATAERMAAATAATGAAAAAAARAARPPRRARSTRG